MKLIRDTDNRKIGGYRLQFYEAGLIDKPDEVITETLIVKTDNEGKITKRINTSKEQKFLCVNGPKTDIKMTWADGQKENYSQFNCGENPRSRPKNVPKVVLIYFKPE